MTTPTPTTRQPLTHAMTLDTLVVAGGLVSANGGIQAYSRLLWDAVDRVGSRSLISLGPAEAAAVGAARGVVTTSKWSLVVRVISQRWPADVAIFTHVELIKLLPLLKRRPRCIVAFLNGVEVWQPLGWMTRRSLRRVDRFLSISHYTWERFSTANPEFAARPHAVLYLGIGDSAGKEAPPPQDPPTALILGRMAQGEDYKGHRQLIAAWPRIRQRVPGARLGIAGGGDLRAELAMLAKRSGVAEAISFFGRVSEEEKQDLLRRARCFAMPSRGEGFGLVYLEAMRLGRPCLVGNQDAGREVVNPPEAGIAVDPDDSAALVDAMGQLLSPGPRWAQWSTAARRRYDAFFTAEHFQKRLLDQLHDLAAGDC